MLNPITTPFKIVLNPRSLYEALSKPVGSFIAVSLFWYALGLSMIAALVGTFIAPNFIDFSKSTFADVQSAIPQDAQFSLAGGTLTTSLDVPTTIPLSKKPQFLEENNLAIIDTTSPAESISQKDALMLFSSKAISIAGINSKDAQVIPYSELTPDGDFTGKSIHDELQILSEALDTVSPWIIPILFVAGLFPVFLSRLLFVVIYSLLIQTIASFSSRSISYKDAFKIGILTLLYAELINIALLVIYQASFPFLFTVSFLTISTVLTQQLPKRVV